MNEHIHVYVVCREYNQFNPSILQEKISKFAHVHFLSVLEANLKPLSSNDINFWVIDTRDWKYIAKKLSNHIQKSPNLNMVLGCNGMVNTDFQHLPNADFVQCRQKDLPSILHSLLIQLYLRQHEWLSDGVVNQSKIKNILQFKQGNTFIFNELLLNTEIPYIWQINLEKLLQLNGLMYPYFICYISLLLKHLSPLYIDKIETVMNLFPENLIQHLSWHSIYDENIVDNQINIEILIRLETKYQTFLKA